MGQIKSTINAATRKRRELEIVKAEEQAQVEHYKEEIRKYMREACPYKGNQRTSWENGFTNGLDFALEFLGTRK